MRNTFVLAIITAAIILSLPLSLRAADNEEAMKYMLDAYKAAGNQEYDKALGLFDKAIEIDPANAKAYEGKASIYNFRQDLDGTAYNYGKAFECDPENLDYAYQYAVLLGAQNRHADSLSVLDKALTVEPENRILLGYKGAVLNILHRFEEAEAVYRRGIELYPEAGGMYSGLGYSLAGLERYGEAVDSLKNALVLLGKRDRNTWVALAMALKRSGGEENINTANAILVGIIKGGGVIDEHAVCALALLEQTEDMYKALDALLKERPTSKSILRKNLKLKDYWGEERFQELMKD